MFEAGFFIKGLLIGLSVAAAIGPIALLCIHRTLTEGFRAGFSVGLGAALADGFYGAIAGAGLVTLSNFLLSYKDVISIMGGVFLLWLGIKSFRTFSGKKISKKEFGSSSLLKIFFSSFFLTLSSPFTILMFTAIFSSVGLIGIGSEGHIAVSLILGVFVGSTVWWLVLAGSVNVVREKISDKMLVIINKVSSVMLLSFACYALAKPILS